MDFIIKKLFLYLWLLLGTTPVFACDSTILAILAGENLNTSTVNKFLSVSDRLQAEGDMLNAYNIAAAKQIHSEVMQNWLKIVSELGTAPMVPTNYREEFVSLLPEISKDLGKVRKKLQTDSLVSIHEIIETSVIKISILGAQINNKPLIYDFMKFELMVYKPGIYLEDSLKFTKETKLDNLENIIFELKKNYSEKSSKLADDFVEILQTHRLLAQKVENKAAAIEKLITSYNDLKNSFVKMKQQLLDDGYFK